MKSSINVVSPDGSFYAYVAKPNALPAPAVVVIQEAFGVNADLEATCNELAAQGFLAVSPDLYWRQEPGLALSDKTDWDRAYALYKTMDIDLAVRDVQTTVAQLKQSELCNGRVGVMGFCLGALLTYLCAVRGGVEVGVCYYGGRTEEFLKEAPKLAGPLLMHIGALDEFISPAQTRIKEALAPLGAEVHIYDGCFHAFARHNGTRFDAQAAALANGRTAAFLRRYLVDNAS